MSHADVIAGLPWRVGSQLGRTLYAVNSKGGGDMVFGMVDDPIIAQYICETHNKALEADRAQ
jgi:hypothetical protein